MSSRRLFRLARVGARHLIGHLRGRQPVGPQRLRLALEEAGGTFIKLGQMLALQSDVLPVAYCNALFDLMDRVPPFTYAEAKQVLAEELGDDPRRFFEAMDRVPVAAASIGQVHRAVVDGYPRAVKVQRPGVEESFGADLRILSFLSRQVLWWLPSRYRWLGETLGEFVEWTREELDYRIEARYMDEIARRSADNPRSRVPRVDWSLTTDRVLTAEFLDGIPLVEVLRGDQATGRMLPTATAARLVELNFHPESFASNIVENFLTDAFHHGIFHADLHPANLLVLADNVVGYVDFGITGVLSRGTRQGLVAMTWAYVRGDVARIADRFLELSTLEPGADPQVFRRELQRLSADWFEPGPGGVRLRRSFTHTMLVLTRLSHKTRIWPHREIVRYFRSVIALEGLITRFAPRFDLGSELERHCRGVIGRQSLLDAVAFDHVADQLLAVSRLVESGPSRLCAMLDAGGSTDTVPASRSKAECSATRRSFRLAMVGLAMALLAQILAPASVPGGPTVDLGASFGLGPSLAAGLLSCVAVFQSLRRLLRGSREIDASSGPAL